MQLYELQQHCKYNFHLHLFAIIACLMKNDSEIDLEKLLDPTGSRTMLPPEV